MELNLFWNKLRENYLDWSSIWADAGYSGQLVDWVNSVCRWILEIVKRSDGVKGFQVHLRRWVVECTFGWLGRYRHLSKDYEELTESSQALIYAAMIHLMVRRLCRIKKSR